VYLDWESSDISVGPETDYIAAWCKTVANAGYQPGVYCHPSEVSVIAAQLALAPYHVTAQFWVAAWTNPSVSSSTTQFPTYDPTQAQASATSWQYGDVYSIQTVNGLLSPVDLDTSSLYGTSDTTRNWTVILYLDGDNNLDAYMADELSQVESVGSNNGVNLVVLRDGPLSNDSQAFSINSNGSQQSIPLSNINSTWSNEVNMSDGTTLSSFADYAINQYPAAHYLIELKDHGSSWTGTCQDETSGNA